MPELADTVAVLRQLIHASAPEPERAAPVLSCAADEALDNVIPFSSVIVLGAVVAVEHHFDIRVSSALFKRACRSGATLNSLADMIAEAKGAS